MQGLTKVSIAVVCALGVTAAIAQTVQPRTQGATQARPPVQIAQTVFPPAGGASTGGSISTVTGVTAGTAAAGTITFVTIGVVAVGSAASDSGSGSTVTHNP